MNRSLNCTAGNTTKRVSHRELRVNAISSGAGRHAIELTCDERYYVPSEITWLLKSLGFTSVEIFGARLGAFSRNDPLTTEDFEMLVVAAMHSPHRMP